MYETYLKKIQIIAEFLAKSPHPEQALDLLSAEISPLNEVSVVYRGRVQEDGLIKCENLHGLSVKAELANVVMRISESRPISSAARTQKLVWAKYDTVLQEFSDYRFFDKSTPWKSLVSVPINLNWVYSLSFSDDLTELPGINNYIESIQSLIKVYESALEIRNLSNGRTITGAIEHQPLTARQEQILEFLKEGKTNKSIAQAIGYSESLVRHETMIIYKKLRVDGRHQLKEYA